MSKIACLVLLLLISSSESQATGKKEITHSKANSDGHMSYLLRLLIEQAASIKNIENKIEKQESTLETLAKDLNNIKAEHDDDQSKLESKFAQEISKLEGKHDQEINKLNSGLTAATLCPSNLPAKWRDHCYGGFHMALTYYSARTYCRNIGAELVWITSIPEQHFIKSTFLPLKINTWIGCNDIAHEGRFVWSYQNQRVAYSNWAPREPSGRTEDCCMMGWPDSHHALGQWNDKDCNVKLENFICKK